MNLTVAFITDSLGPSELIFIFVVILVLFGPRRLPEVAKMFGKTMNQLRKASQDFKDQIMRIEDSAVIDVTPVESSMARTAPSKAQADASKASGVSDGGKSAELSPGEDYTEGGGEEFHGESDKKTGENTGDILDKQAEQGGGGEGGLGG